MSERRGAGTMIAEGWGGGAVPKRLRDGGVRHRRVGVYAQAATVGWCDNFIARRGHQILPSRSSGALHEGFAAENFKVLTCRLAG